MQLAGAHRIEKLRMPPRRARGLNPLVGNAFREMQHALTPGKHRGAPLLEIQLARIHLPQVDEQLRLDRIPAPDQIPDPLEQL